MKNSYAKPTASNSPLKLGVVSACLWAALNVSAYSQSAEIFEAEKRPAAGETVAKSSKDTPAPGPVDTQPSRFAGQDIEPYIAARAAVFSMRNRPTDSFGLFQDPNAKPVIRQMVSNVPTKRQSALPPTPLSDIIKLIRVTTIMPGEKKFLVGTRSFSEGAEFPMDFQGKRMNMKVLEVNSRKILFLNMDNGERATLETEMLPPGMIVGVDKMKPPGLVNAEANLPLNLEPGLGPDSGN